MAKTHSNVGERGSARYEEGGACFKHQDGKAAGNLCMLLGLLSLHSERQHRTEESSTMSRTLMKGDKQRNLITN